MADLNAYKLCYISSPWAYFTTQPLDQQWGDDWNDAPYEHNAGAPYTFDDFDKSRGKTPWDIIKIAFDSDLSTPSDWVGNSKFSVEMINSGMVAWLSDAPTRGDKAPYTNIFAGTSLPEFVHKIVATGGRVYVDPNLKWGEMV